MDSKKINVFINGFGRIGRLFARIILQDERFRLVGINDIYSFEQMRYLLKYDSIYGTLPSKISLKQSTLFVDNHKIKLFCKSNSEDMDIISLNIDILAQCSGLYLTIKSNLPFLQSGAKKVIVSAPPLDNMPTYIYGVNHKEYLNETIISNSSCSANAIVPIFKIIDKYFGIDSAMMSMYHSYTVYQNLLDSKHYSTDIRRTRCATQNIIPLMSGAGEATAYFFSHLKKRLYAKSIRVPIPSMTFYSLHINLLKSTTKEEVEKTFLKEITLHYKNILKTTDSVQVSSDYIKDPHSAIINLPLISVAQKTLLNISVWQDNEYGYAKRLVDMAYIIGKSI